MRCPECGEASNGRLKYCENCGAKMPASPEQLTGPRPAVRSSRPGRKASSEPAYAEEILEEVEERSRPYAVGNAPELPPEDKTDPGDSRPAYDGPRWLASVPAHSPTVAGVGVLGLALVLSILPFFSSAGVVGSGLALVACVLLVARELREAGEAPGFTEVVPESLLRPEAAALGTAVLAALAVRVLRLDIVSLLWLVGAGLVVHDQWRKVLGGPDGVVERWFEPRELLQMPRVAALGGVAACLLTLFAPWATVSTGLDVLPANAPVPQGLPQLRVINAPRPTDDVLYSRGGDIASLSGWDLPASEVVELALLAMLALLALRPEVARPAWARFVPAGCVALALVWAAVNMRLAVGPIAFVIGLGAVGFVAAMQLREGPPPSPSEYEYEE
ncbi:zinc ribbon domain-containing protein [Pyxidicoccus fallax]|uniref:Zinc ribbon domain-containing protein n=1 Tax=Pyxidicoccus fallax TaxID=394095 RepID=A0A848LWC9_9BACT|nr:zinc ribbon domain-containing protein [Pyxidicoccus fallax]NMO21862.1 zinc ribbon domain-containing protein [Pyxidicoccus fallax]NPC83330.1 zinc ribbon domain-containing protein [Pyxidicoccus fallax]